MILHFSELTSTNSYLKENLDGLPGFSVVRADYQTAGRGQRGNGWESEAGRNLLMSMLYFPPGDFPPSSQFLISEAVSLSVVEVVDRLLEGRNAPEVCVKWPNDIYIGDRKVAGILIENALQSPRSFSHTVIGIGLNVNQRKFLSDAPNPASLVDYTGEELPLGEVTTLLVDALKRNLACLSEDGVGLCSRYKRRLWRREGFHPYVSLIASSDPAPTAVSSDVCGPSARLRFDAEFVDVAPAGPLTLRLRSGERVTFNFKEVAPVI